MEGAKMLRELVVALMLFSLTSGADARVVLRDYIAAAKDEKARNVLKIYLSGVIDGIIYFDAALAIEGRQLFCKPDDVTLTFDQAEDIMMREAQDMKDVVGGPGDYPVSLRKHA
jgi:hypothetical protein